MTDALDIIKTGRKGKHLNTSEKFHIYRISKDNLHVNDLLTHTTPCLRHYTSFMPDSSTHKHTHTPSHVIKAGLGTLNIYNIYIHRPINNKTTLAAWRNVQQKMHT
jgi:hypothetical protein